MRGLVLLLAVFSLLSVQTHAYEPVVCDSHQSRLCADLIEWWDMDEEVDSCREGSLSGTLLLESQGEDVGYGDSKVPAEARTTASARFDNGHGHLLLPRDGGLLGSSWTVGAWVFPTTSTRKQQILSTALNGRGFTLQLRTAGDALKACAEYYGAETRTLVAIPCGGTLYPSRWNLVVWAASPYGGQGRGVFKISVNGGAFTATALPQTISSGKGNDLSVGRDADGVLLDGLGFWGFAFTDEDMRAYYKSGSGVAYPFY